MNAMNNEQGTSYNTPRLIKGFKYSIESFLSKLKYSKLWSSVRSNVVWFVKNTEYVYMKCSINIHRWEITIQSDVV